MEFEEKHAAWLSWHLERRKGERKSRLEHGHRHGEWLFLKNIWYPLFGDFMNLHPEYEICDMRNRSYFADLMWKQNYLKLVIEIKGYNPHVRDQSRRGFCEELNRETFIQALGYRVISFAYDDVEQRPEVCQMLLRLFLGQFEPKNDDVVKGVTRLEKEIILLAFKLARPLRPIDVANHLQVISRTARQSLQTLCQKGWFRPIEVIRKGDKPLKNDMSDKGDRSGNGAGIGTSNKISKRNSSNTSNSTNSTSSTSSTSNSSNTNSGAALDGTRPFTKQAKTRITRYELICTDLNKINW